MPKSIEERLKENVPCGEYYSLKEIADMIGNKPHTALKQRLMLTENISYRRVLSKSSPIANTWLWQFIRHDD